MAKPLRERWEVVVDGAAAAGDCPHRPRDRRRGHSLVEIIVTLLMLGVLLSMGVPQFQRSLEHSRADLAGASLRAIWSAQRLYWLQSRAYAPDLDTLLAANLIDPSLATVSSPYTYSVDPSDPSGFKATATRTGSSVWSGSFSVAADGTFSGSVQPAGGSTAIVPGFQ
jgi:type II secretory pathway pseudopilin PulG